MLSLEFRGEIWHWRGPAPWYFVTIPAEESCRITAVSSLVTYGWGVIPVQVQIGKTGWRTSLFPKEERYLVPIKASARKAENLEKGDIVTIQLDVHL